MNKELDDLLCKRYPLIFVESNFGFGCNDGWFYLIDTLCQQLQHWTEVKQAQQVVAIQVKEKFGQLCFYPRTDVSSEQWAMISMAEALSLRICDQCGNQGRTVIHQHHHMTRCKAHTPSGAQIKIVEQ